MRDSSNLHQKVQEMCDCYATNDPLKEMSIMQHEKNTDEAAVKWLALAILHGINSNAEQISIKHTKNGKVRVVAEYRKADLPPPDKNITEQVMSAVKEILHVDSSQGESTLAVGVRNNSMDLRIKIREEKGDGKVTIIFP